MIIKMVLKDVGVGKNGAKVHLLESIILHVQGLNFEKGIYKLEDHVGQEALNLNLLLFSLGL